LAEIERERTQTANEIREIGFQVKDRDASVAELLGRLADAVQQGRPHETRGYLDAIDPKSLAELIVARLSPIWAILEVARNVLVFAPIAVTWFGLSLASTAYAEVLTEKPDLVTRPFLLLWQEGFTRTGYFLNFSTLALIDASLIGILIILSLAIHLRAELRDAAIRAKALLKESEIRGLLGHAAGLASADLSEAGAEEVLDQMAAEERRIYERAMEREQQLFNLEGAVHELNQAASQLARVAETLADRTRDDEKIRSRG
jgi:hypothetical protein